MSIPIIYSFLANPLSGAEIEKLSFEVIDREVGPHGFSLDEWEVVRRMIHTTGDPTIARAVRFSPMAISSGVRALRSGAPIVVDANMIRAGLSIERLCRSNGRYSLEMIHCCVSDADVAEQSSRCGLPRSLFAVRKARPVLNGSIVAFGNAPVALLELNRMMMEEGIRPALVIGMPVGFVHVQESKEELLSLSIPSIVVTGRRGGSTLAVSVIHALCSIATSMEVAS